MDDLRKRNQEDFVLAKCRVLKSDKNLNDDSIEVPITDFGVHWDEKGECVDIPLVKKVAALYKALHLDEVDQIAAASGVKGEREFLEHNAKESKFWNDAVKFMGILNRNSIDSYKLLTYRKLSFVIQDFVSSTSTKQRENMCHDMKTLMDKRFEKK